MESELRRLSHRADEEQQADRGQRRHIKAEEVPCRGGVFARLAQHRAEFYRAEEREDPGDPEREADIADPIHDKRLHRGRVGGAAFVPVSDEQVGAESDAFPAEEHLQEVVGGDKAQHEKGEERQVAHEARQRAVAAHVSERVDMHGGRDERDDAEHHGGESVHIDRPGDFQRAGADPGEEGFVDNGVAEREIQKARQ